MIYRNMNGKHQRRLARGFVIAGWLWMLAMSCGCTGGSRTSPTPASNELQNSIGMALVRIPAGEFRMGCEEPTSDSVPDGPQHLVVISRPFCVGKYEVTQDEYEQIMGNNP